MNDPTPMTAQTQSVKLELRQHGICWILPHGGSVQGAVVDLPGGALIQGRFSGRILCRAGSLIIERGAELCGHAEAQSIYVEGKILASSSGEVSSLKGHRLVAISDSADGCANVYARAFAIHTLRFNARLTTLGG